MEKWSGEHILQEVDRLFAANKGKEAEQLLQDGIQGAMRTGDDDVLLTLLNELIGYYRETSRTQASYQLADSALKLMERMELKGLAYGTTLLNIANAYRAGGRLEDSLKYYQICFEIYEDLLPPEDMLFASLYNNFSLLYQEMNEHSKAKEYLEKALEIVKQTEGAFFEQAVTYSNLASTCLVMNQDEEAEEYLKSAVHIFEEHQVQDAHYSAALSALGTFHYKKGSYEEAEKYFRKAMKYIKASLGENDFYKRLQDNLEACRRARGVVDICGMELCKSFYEEYGKPMIDQYFGDYAGKIAIGMVGEGSDCFGYDDEFSRDHDFGPGFSMWVSKKTYQEIGGQLQEAYEQLPKEFMGFCRKNTKMGEGRVGVHTIEGFYQYFIGTENWEEINWSEVPDASLAAVVNGEVFRDDEGVFTQIRNRLLEGYPESIRYLKIAESMGKFSQSGQYNYNRMLQRNDELSAHIMLSDGIREAMKLCYYIEGKYPPHDKWLLRGLKDVISWEEMYHILQENRTDKLEWIEDIGSILTKKLYGNHIISDTNNYLDSHTEEILLKSVLLQKSEEELIETIIKLEFEAFDKVKNEGGRASCQDDWTTFYIMRKSQYLTWNPAMLIQYCYDFKRELSLGHNMIEEKYGRMMESTDPEEYNKMKNHFPLIHKEKAAIIEAIVSMQVKWMEELKEKHPDMVKGARVIHSYEDTKYDTSYETYLRGEISTYSDKMLELYGRYVVSYAQKEESLPAAIMNHTLKMYETSFT